MKRIWIRTVLWIALVLVVVVYALPFLYLVSTSLKTPIETIAIPPAFFPENPSLQNYIDVFTDPRVPKAFVNSVVVAVLSTAITVVLAVPAAYGIVRSGSRLGRGFVVGVLIIRMVPAIAVGIPLSGMLRSFGLFDTQLGVALAHTTVSLPLAIWLLTSFFDAIPREMEEAARVDGCTRFAAFLRVVVPVSGGGIAVATIFAFLGSWNEYLFTLLLSTFNAQTVPIVIAQFKTQYGLEWGAMTALAALYSVPMVIVALLLQKRIVGGMTMGAIKG